MVCLVAGDSVFVTWIDFFKRTIAAIFVTLSFGCCVYAGSYAENITCRIEQETVQRFSDAVFPMVLTGKKRVTVKILGAAVSRDGP